jgi:hypothetical protein
MTQEQTEKRLKQALAAISLESMISGFQAYRETYKQVLQSPRRFASQRLLPWQPGMLQSAMSTLLYGIAVSFLMYVPLIQKHGLELGKLYFLLQHAYRQLLLVCVIHLSVKAFRGRGTLSQTATAYCIWSGIMGPIIIIISYPAFFYVPIVDLFAPVDPILLLQLLPRWVQWWSLALTFVLLLVLFLTLFQWIADVHQITKRRLLLAMLLIYLPIIMTYQSFVDPYISKGLRLTSDALQNLL